MSKHECARPSARALLAEGRGQFEAANASGVGRAQVFKLKREALEPKAEPSSRPAVKTKVVKTMKPGIWR